MREIIYKVGQVANSHGGVHAEDVGLLLAVALLGVHSEHERLLVQGAAGRRRRRCRRRRRRRRGGNDLGETARDGQGDEYVQVVERKYELVLWQLRHVPDALEASVGHSE